MMKMFDIENSSEVFLQKSLRRVLGYYVLQRAG